MPSTHDIVSEWIAPASHLDHNIPRETIVEVLIDLHDDIISALEAEGIYRETTHKSNHRSLEHTNLQSALYGPSCGDAPITDEEVTYEVRGLRPHPSRLINKPARPTDLITVIVGMHEGRPTLFTAFGGPLAPREPTPESDPNSYEVTFWRDHALAK